MNRIKLIVKNVRFFTPILWKKIPLIFFIVPFCAIINSFQNILTIATPSIIIYCIEGNYTLIEIITILVIILIIIMVLNILSRFHSLLKEKNKKIINIYIDELLSETINEAEYEKLEDPIYLDYILSANKGMKTYTYGVFSTINILEWLITSFITATSSFIIIFSSGEYLLIFITILVCLFKMLFSEKEQKIDKDFNEQFIRNIRKLDYYNFQIYNLNNQKEIRLYGCENEFIRFADKVNGPSLDLLKKNLKIRKKFYMLENILSFLLTYILPLIILAYAAISKNMSIALLTLLFSSSQELSKWIGNIVYGIKEYIYDCEYQQPFIDLISNNKKASKGTILIEGINKIEFKNVSFKYPRTEEYVLKNINIIFEKGKKYSLVGLNGSGKTTLIKLLCRLYYPTYGEIYINDINIKEINYENLVSYISAIFQDYKITSFSIKDNIEFDSNNTEKLYDSLEKAQFIDRVKNLINKEYTYVNKWFDNYGVDFSGGELQKIAIARCIYKNCGFFILDEPTASLDAQSESKIYNDINAVLKKSIVLFISHRLSSCIFSDKIYVINKGEIIEEGSHTELMDMQSFYSTLFNEQSKLYHSNE